MAHIFKRKIYDKLLEWKNKDNGRTALLLQGARRIGKSTIVEDFARKEYESYILIDFNKASTTIKHLFDDLMDLDFIFLTLQTIYNVVLVSGKSVIIFDEVQKCPMARQAIKYLVQDGRYHYIETGSLISIQQNTKNITIPSEEKKMDMYPMDLEEFQWALNDNVSMPIVRQFFDTRRPLGPAHRFRMRDLRLYTLIGGMPQAVSAYIDTNNFSFVDDVKRSIIQLYYDDFIKLDPTKRLSKLFMSIPSQLSQNALRYYPGKAIGQTESTTRLQLLSSLEDSKTVLVSYHSNDPNIGLSLTQDHTRYKLFLCDTGLFTTMVFWDKDFTENVIYKQLLSDRLDVNLGYVYENLLAQMLTAMGDKLFYYTFPKDSKHSYEIDFLISRGNKLSPIEVKSSGYKTHASLDAFCTKFSSRIKDKYLIYTKDLTHDGDIQYLPFYMVPFI